MTFDAQAIRDANRVSDIASKHIKLTRAGSEFSGLCPFHNERSPSFTINDAKGFYHCFGCGAHGDVIALVQNLHNVSFTDACEMLNGEKKLPGAIPKIKEHKETPSIYASLKPVTIADEDIPAVGERLRCWNPKREQWTQYFPSMVFPYRLKDGTPVGVVIRVELKDGKKITPTLRMVETPEGERVWSHMPFDEPRPLYGLDRLARSNVGQALVVEGEKAAEAAHRLIGHLLPVITWPGGGNGVEYADWGPLDGLKLVLWPDADQPGQDAMLGHRAKDGEARPGVTDLARKAGAGEIKLIPWDKKLPKGYDAADMAAEGADAETMLSWLKKRAEIWESGKVEIAEVEDEAAPDDFGPGDARDYSVDLAPTQPPFRILGYNKDSYFYHPHGKQQIVELAAGGHTQSNLFTLAPLSYWKEICPPTSPRLAFDVTSAADMLIQMAHQCGIFSLNRMRGRGAWIDNGQPVMHMGSTVFVAGQELKPTDVPSRFIYELAEPLHIGRQRPATKEEAHRLVKICEGITWENTISADLLAGWCVLAPICGALKWRPHIWVSGPSGSGKSTVVDEIIQRIVGPLAEKVDGNTSEAGIRQDMQHDARPIIVDEFESETKKLSDLAQGIVGLARISSSGGVIRKGSTNGLGVRYAVRSCFAFSSINISIDQYADETRISKLILRVNTSPDADEHFKKLMRDINEWFTPEFAEMMFARTVEMMPTLLKNVVTFTNAAATVLKSRRAADQIGTLLAGKYLCHSDGEVDFDAAVAWIKARNWSEHAQLDAGGDERKLLTKIATTVRRLQLNHGAREMTIGEMIMMMVHPSWEDPIEVPLLEAATRELARLGIKVVRADTVPVHDPEYSPDDYFIIANKSNALTKILEGTPWAKDWVRPMRTLGGPESAVKPTYFSPGLKERGTRILVSLLRGE